MASLPPHFLSHSLTYPVLALSLTELQHVRLPEFVSLVIHVSTARLRIANTHCVCISSGHMHAPLFFWTLLTKHKFEDKIVRNFKFCASGYQILGLCRGGPLVKPDLPNTAVLVIPDSLPSSFSPSPTFTPNSSWRGEEEWSGRLPWAAEAW